jgi:raffinose/stachyose/melibiose transport system substrate-binding protein
MRNEKSHNMIKSIAPVGITLLVFPSFCCTLAAAVGCIYYLAKKMPSPSAEAVAESAAAAPSASASPSGTIGPPTPTVEPTPADPVTISWWHINDREDFRLYWRGLADAYMADHPSVTIEITLPESSPYKSRLRTVMQAGDPPDIFHSWGGDEMNAFAEAGLLKDITEDLDADKGAWRNTFGRGVLGLYAFDGAHYGVPWDAGMVGIWYNKALFARAGIHAPPATWAEFLDIVRTLKDAGITPVALGEGDRWPGMFWFAYLALRIGGPAAFEAAYSRTGSFADPAFIEAGREIRELMDLSPFQDGFLGAAYNDAAALMGDGRAAMELMGQWAPNYQENASADGDGIGDNLGFFSFPAVAGGAGRPDDAFGGGNGFAVGRDAPPQAVDFLKYLTRVESQVQCAREGFCLPVVNGGEAGLTDPLMIAVQQTLAKAEYLQLYYDSYLGPAIGEVVLDSVRGIFDGSLTSQQAAQAIEDCAEQELE